jgi:LemA protein
MSSFSITLICVIFTGVVFAILVAYLVGLYNSLIQVKNNVDKSFKNIDVLLMQRHDELPKLIDTCKGYMKHERELLETLTTLREHYSAADTTDKKTQLENQINQQYLALAARWEAYPDLKAQQNFIQIQERIAGLESAIADRRELFNDSVNIYNIQIERFPHVILARIFSYVKKAYLEVPAEKKADVKIDFS